MKMSQGKKFAFLLALVLMVPLLWNQRTAMASAAAPAFSKSTVTIVGAAKTYQTVINNKVTGSTYKWSSTATKVATVSSKGLVTSVGYGTATIKCKITYTSGKSTTLSCTVNVTIPATAVAVNNANDKETGAHALILNSSYDFNLDLTPANTSDKVYWSVGGGDASCIRIDDPLAGKVTAIKTGHVILTATAAKTTDKADLEKSIIKDEIIIEVVGQSAGINTAEITGSAELKVTFDSPIDKSTVIDANGGLSGNIEITTRKDAKGVLGQDPGKLTAILSADNKQLTITAEKAFNGNYGINFSSNIKTLGGIAISSYYKLLNYSDTIPPYILSTAPDDTGMFATIVFSEAVDFTDFKALDARAMPPATCDASSIAFLTNRLNYVISGDKKSMKINLSKLIQSDQGKTFEVTISGIKDMQGNIPASYTLKLYLRADNTPKPQAKLVSVVRTGYYTISAIFDRPIQSTGWMIINGATINGAVDPNNNKKVNYTITDAQATLTGSKTVSIGAWNSYNVISTDTSASLMRDVSVNFTIETTKPEMYSSSFDTATSTLTLMYNEEVTLASATGTLSFMLITNTEDIQSGSNITYTKLESTDNKVIKLKLGNMPLVGSYTVSLDPGFVYDNFRNASTGRTIALSNTAGGSTSELPGPILITQSTENLSQIYLEFTSKLDMASAQNKSNYIIQGVPIISAQLINNSSTGATVLLTVADNSIDVTVERPITIKGVKGYAGNYGEITNFVRYVELRDNKKPKYVASSLAYDKNDKNIIRFNFDEQVQGTMTVKVYQYDNPLIVYSSYAAVSGSSVAIVLDSLPTYNTYLKIDLLTNNVTDASGNQADIPAALGGVPVTW